jgi:hypothetical protein
VILQIQILTMARIDGAEGTPFMMPSDPEYSMMDIAQNG